MVVDLRLSSSEDLGNRSYGTFGAAFGFTRVFLHIGAGVYQIIGNSEKDINWDNSRWLFDEERDYYYIDLGYDDYYRNR